MVRVGEWRKKTFFFSFYLFYFVCWGWGWGGGRGEWSRLDILFRRKEFFKNGNFTHLERAVPGAVMYLCSGEMTNKTLPPHPHPLSASPDHPHGLHSQSKADPASQLHYANLSVNSNSCRGIQHSEQFPDLYCPWPPLHTNRVDGALHPAPTLPSLLPAWDAWQYLWETTVYFLNGSSALCKSKPRPYPVHLSRAHCLS